MAESDSSLSVLFEEAKARYALLDQLDSRNGEYKDAFQAAISSFEQCRQLIQKGAIFSRNETVDDISTSTLP